MLAEWSGDEEGQAVRFSGLVAMLLVGCIAGCAYMAPPPRTPANGVTNVTMNR